MVLSCGADNGLVVWCCQWSCRVVLTMVLSCCVLTVVLSCGADNGLMVLCAAGVGRAERTSRAERGEGAAVPASRPTDASPAQLRRLRLLCAPTLRGHRPRHLPAAGQEEERGQGQPVHAALSAVVSSSSSTTTTAAAAAATTPTTAAAAVVGEGARVGEELSRGVQLVRFEAGRR